MSTSARSIELAPSPHVFDYARESARDEAFGIALCYSPCYFVFCFPVLVDRSLRSYLLFSFFS